MKIKANGCSGSVTRAGGYYAGQCGRIAGHTGKHRREATRSDIAARKAARAPAAPSVPAPRVAVLQGNGVYGLGMCPRCAPLPRGQFCPGCKAEIADKERLWG